jgi:hypothetical protein
MMELDSHANTCTLGANFRVIAHTDKSCNVTPYHPEYQTQLDVPIVQAATAYTDPQTGDSYILIINQGLIWVTSCQPHLSTQTNCEALA